MSDAYQQNYDIEYYRPDNSYLDQADLFSPSIQSLKSAQDAIWRYEKSRLEMAKRDFECFGTVTSSRPVFDLSIAVGDKIIPLRSRVWPRPASRARARRSWPPYALSPASRSRRTHRQREAWRSARHVGALTPSPTPSRGAMILDDVQSGMLERFGVMATQGLAIVLGFGGLLMLLKML
jgi:hypothetical protein